MSSSSQRTSQKKIVVPKVWKRPHSTIYGKNVEFGSALYSDKIGEINSRKFNSELPYSVRNSPLSHTSYNVGAPSSSDGYLSNPMFSGSKSLQLVTPASSNSPLTSRSLSSDGDLVRRATATSNCYDFKDMLEATNPSRRRQHDNNRHGSSTHASRDRAQTGGRVDFYATYLDDFNRELSRQTDSSLMSCDPLLRRKVFDDFLDFDYELGLFLPATNDSIASSMMQQRPLVDAASFSLVEPNSSSSSDYRSSQDKQANYDNNNHYHYRPSTSDYDLNHNNAQSVPMTLLATTTIKTPITKTNQTTQNTHLLPKHRCQLSASPYGQSADGRKLSLASIDPMSYRPPVPSKSTSAHATGGEEFELHDRSSPFYTDR